VRTAKTVFLNQGILVYSHRLPFYYLFFGKAFGSKWGKALLIPNQLTDFDDLKERVGMYCRFSTPH
jgi:hypothetical protein